MSFRIIGYITVLLTATAMVSAQGNISLAEYEAVYSPVWTLRHNVAAGATGSLNIGAEYALGNRLTLEGTLSYNRWKYGKAPRFKHFLLRPELRYWPTAVFNGCFVGCHLHGGQFNLGGFDAGILRRHRYQGDFIGGGATFGYHHWLGGRWAFELAVGAGYTYIDYERFLPDEEGKADERGYHHYAGFDRLGVTLIYLLK